MKEQIKHTFEKLTVDEFLDLVFNSQEFWNYLYECADPIDAYKVKQILYENKLSEERRKMSMAKKCEMLGIPVPEWLIVNK